MILVAVAIAIAVHLATRPSGDNAIQQQANALLDKAPVIDGYGLKYSTIVKRFVIFYQKTYIQLDQL